MNCKIHGNTGPAILCKHLVVSNVNQNIGWIQAEYDPENPAPGDLMAWCSDCDDVYEQDNGWNDSNDQVFKVVCKFCFSEIKQSQVLK